MDIRAFPRLTRDTQRSGSQFEVEFTLRRNHVFESDPFALARRTVGFQRVRHSGRSQVPISKIPTDTPSVVIDCHSL